VLALVVFGGLKKLATYVFVVAGLIGTPALAAFRLRFARSNFMKKSWIIAATLAGFGTSALAADLPVKAAPYVSPPAVLSWNGFYVGLNLGAREDQVSATTTSVVVISGLPLPPSLPSSPLSQSVWSFRLGPYAGYNWQIGSQWLVGIEGDWAWANRTAAFVGSAYPNPTSIIFVTPGSPDTFSVKTEWDASIRARMGFLASPNMLLYLAGGPAWMKVDTTSACVAGGPGRVCYSLNPLIGGLGFTQSVITNSSAQLGWTLGGGLEAMVAPGWILRAEYRYSDYGTVSNTDTRQFTPGAATVFGQAGYNVAYDVHVRTNVATIGIAYKFGM
jgi:outer membrane immunogenic protein